jgi:hypothetical protein
LAAYALLAAAVAWFYAIGAETGWLPGVHRIILGHWFTGVMGGATLAGGLCFGLEFLSALGGCVLAAWFPLQLPPTRGAAVQPPAFRRNRRDADRKNRQRKRKPRQKTHRRS